MLVATERTFAERLRQLREAAGLSQYALAKKSGVSAQAISKIELGEREPGWGTVVKLANALGVSVAAFNGDADQAEPESAEEPPAEELPAAPRRRKPKSK